MSEVTNTSIAIDIANLTKNFGDKLALDNFSLRINPGTFFVLLGPSGSGKTTLLRCLAGIERPSAGTISLSGREVVNAQRFVAPEKRSLAMVFQDYALWPHLSVAKNVGFPLHKNEMTNDAREARVRSLLERVGIAHLAERYPNQLSGGEQQRVALARALAADVGLILFDEPLSNLDADRRERLRIEIGTLTRESGATAVYITHDQSEAFALADQVGVMREGRLLQVGTPEEIYRAPANAFVARFTGLAGELALATVTRISPTRARVALTADGELEVEARLVSDVPANAHLFLRASAVTILNEPQSGVMSATISDVAFTGRGYEHVVELSTGETLTKIFSPSRFNRSQQVGLAIDPEQCFVFSQEE